MIYLDNAATSLQKPKEVEEEMIRALHTMGNPGRGAHDATLQAGRCVYQVREQLAQLLTQRVLIALHLHQMPPKP